ncbi:uncharacterized protein BHQ10_008466 [Talaromyces amestolkiae]|uniref:Uncharacterized protein n=1 Tax=Talaromyces amestolkiae TaxID=1196081 RepID=A0A364L9G4_TALAM|nr:uncharacterized protein BHQ10_008466 [Talaromyces amestolkiae]RAO72454.1 hypothetical protein BHQ10_008466 [Talaromyces amestolkiae]
MKDKDGAVQEYSPGADMCNVLPAAAQSGSSSAKLIDQAVANVNTRLSQQPNPDTTASHGDHKRQANVPEMALSMGHKRTASAVEDPSLSCQVVTKMIKSASKIQKDEGDEE